MIRPLPALVSGLALALALGAQPAAASAPRLSKVAQAQYRALQPMRAIQAQNHLQGLRAQLGLGERDGFTAATTFTNESGQAIVRLQQTFAGHRVWGGQAVAHVNPDGTVAAQIRQVKTGIALQGEPAISADLALKIALGNLAPKGVMKQAPVVERVVFPAQFLGGLATTVDPVTQRPVIDRRRSVIAKLGTPYVWAYEVHTHLNNPQDGTQSLSYLIDGNTGQILRVTNMVANLGGTTPATGTGKGFYRGNVSVESSLMLDGTYTLIDQTRGTAPNPWLSYFSPDAPTGWDPATPGNQIWYGDSDASGASTYLDYLFQGNLTNTWGDGLAFTDWGNTGGTNGQSAGVDAAAAMATTWDFYLNVFGRNGMDGQGTSIVAKVLDPTHTFYFDGRDNASWDIGNHLASFGIGTYPANPKGFQSMADLDVVAHELTHGLTSPSYAQALYPGGGYEEGGIAEGLSDFFSQMVRLYEARGASDPVDAIPEVEMAWQIGKNVGHGTPLRVFDKPSKDGVSFDAWYSGINRLDSHHSSGPINRALYFLARGASKDPASDSYSSLLPQGSKGVGNDAAARIIYKAVTEYLIGDGTGSYTFEDLRAVAIMAANHLYGVGSFQTSEVKNAFAGANIGDAEGAPATTRVLFSPWRNGDYIQEDHPFVDYSNRQVLACNEAVVPRINVINNANKAVTWSLGGPSIFDSGQTPTRIVGGVINPDGSWTTPNEIGWAAITARSQADTNQFAEGTAWLANLDTDMDLESDALDMGPIALSWYLSRSLNTSSSVIAAPWVDDLDVSFYVDAMKSTWPNK